MFKYSMICLVTGFFLACDTGDKTPSHTTKQWGTIAGDTVNAIAIDVEDNIYFTGHTRGSLDGNNTSAGSSDVFLVKWSADGTSAWIRQWGSPAWDEGRSVAIDPDGNVLVTGFTEGSLDGNVSVGGRDVFLAKWSSDGTKIWSQQWGTEGLDIGAAVTTDEDGNIFVAGHTNGAFGMDDNEAGYDIFLCKRDADGTRIWLEQWGTQKDKFATSITVDRQGGVIVGGYGGREHYDDIEDSLLIKWKTNGYQSWVQRTGTFSGRTDSITIDTTGHIIVVGRESLLSQKVFLARVWNYDGTTDWEKKLISSGSAEGYGVAVDVAGDIYIVGATTGSFEGTKSAGELDAFIAKFHLDGTQVWIRQWGTPQDDMASSIALSSRGVIYAAGNTSGSFGENVGSGGDDIFFTEWQP